MTTSAVNSLVYQPTGAMEAAAAGHILLSIVAVSQAGLVLHLPMLNPLDCLDSLFWLDSCSGPS